ncbi:MAG TPA: hypothetical protein PLW44_16570, partial [Chitinophagales bacterium]|nr:hypothetical protein [Chitinophagales bacterium]
MKSKFLLLIAAFALPLCMWANNIRVKLNSYNPTTKQLNISLAWDNSWHDGSGQFRDGAWLFVKYKDVSNNTWQHAILNTPANTATITDTLSGYNVMFNVIGKNPSTASGYVGSRGYIIRRQQGATATVQSNPEYAGVYNVAMNLTATIVTPPGMLLANPEFRVYAMEVVNIPSGAYYAGDGSYNSIVQTSTTNNSPVYIANENTPVTIAGQAVSQGYPKATY